MGRVPAEARTKLRGYARDVGLAFQIADDLIDHEGEEEKAGKRVGKEPGRQGDVRLPCSAASARAGRRPARRSGGRAFLILARAADEAAAFKRLPWSAVVMVTGMSVLVTVVEKTGGMELFTSLVARFATPGSVNGLIALDDGLISTNSSTSGVVLPTSSGRFPGWSASWAAATRSPSALSTERDGERVAAAQLADQPRHRRQERGQHHAGGAAVGRDQAGDEARSRR